MNHPRIISFYGPDGSGKTTQANLVYEYLEKKNVPVKQVWMRSPHTGAFLISELIKKLGYIRILENPYGEKKILPRVGSGKGLRSTLWAIIELFSAIPVILFRFYLPLVQGTTIVADRFILDTIVNIGFYIQDDYFIESRVSKFLQILIPSSTHFIFLDTEYSILKTRRQNEVEPIDYINYQRNNYRTICGKFNHIYINTGEHSVEETFNLILESIGEKIYE